MTYYVSGGMSFRSDTDWNFPAFHEAAADLRAQGHKVLNPAENHEGRTDLPRHVYMRTDIAQVLSADAVAVLPGWQKSKGARLEVSIAVAIGIPVVWAADLSPVPDALLHPIGCSL